MPTKVKHHDAAEAEGEGTSFRNKFPKHVPVTKQKADTDQQGDREEHHGLEGYPAEAWDNTLMYLALVRHVEKVSFGKRSAGFGGSEHQRKARRKGTQRWS